MGLVGLFGEVVALPFAQARHVGGLIVDAGKAALQMIASRDEHELDRTGTDIAHRRRRFWETEGRAHIELREVEDEVSDAYLKEISESVAGAHGVERVRANPRSGG